jgi:cold-inducible RNA-binding protein
MATAELAASHAGSLGASAERLTVSSKVFVGNLEFSTTKDQLEELFGQVGSIVDVFLPSDRATGKPRGFAFVEFANDDEAQAAIARFDGFEMGGRTLRVNPAEARTPSAGRSFTPGGFSNNAPPRGGYGGGGGKPKGSRRNLRAKKRSL